MLQTYNMILNRVFILHFLKKLRNMSDDIIEAFYLIKGALFGETS